MNVFESLKALLNAGICCVRITSRACTFLDKAQVPELAKRACQAMPVIPIIRQATITRPENHNRTLIGKSGSSDSDP